jgi:TPP-dependent pyruvate/acetoin dehydrogenase alpha subunit
VSEPDGLAGEELLESVPKPLALYYEMLRIRRVEEEIAQRYPQQEMRAPVHLCIGQEAPPVGVSTQLTSRDQALSGHRSHGHYLAKGGDLRRMISELYGKVTGCCRGRGGSQHLVDTAVGFAAAAPILASTLSIATGVAWTLKQRAGQDVVVAYFGDAACEEGVFHESLSFASLHSLPIVFVCENNLYSVHSPLSDRQPDRPISELALAHAMPGITVDGNDVREVSVVASRAIESAREGVGPTLLECKTYRTVGHVGPGVELDMGYRDQTELDYWHTRDPLTIEEGRLALEITDWSATKDQLEKLVDSEIEGAFAFAISSPFPEPEELLMDVYPAKESL